MKNKVIDLDEKRQERLATVLESGSESDQKRLQLLKLKLEVERARLAIPASILSIVVVVSVMNSKILSPGQIQSTELASISAYRDSQGTWLEPQGGALEVSAPQAAGAGRAIASLPTGTSIREDDLVSRISTEVGAQSLQAIGKRPSDLERLALETLGGNYKLAVHPETQKLMRIDLLNATAPVQFDDSFFKRHQSVFPTQFEKALKVSNTDVDLKANPQDHILETYQLVNHLSRPVSQVLVERDAKGQLVRLEVR